MDNPSSESPVRIATVTLRTHLPKEVARFWRDLLGYRVAPNHSSSVLLVGDDGPRLLVQPSDEPAPSGAIHLDLRPEDQSASVRRAQVLGATLADVGQTGDEPWVVMADPGGNVFCILQSQADQERLLAETPGTITSLD